MNYIPKFSNIDDLVSNYKYTSQGHFFDKDTMRFFNSRLTSHFRRLNDSTYVFITTECNFDKTKRFATLRTCLVIPDKDKHCGYKMHINTYGEFNVYTLSKAKTILKNLKENDVVIYA